MCPKNILFGDLIYADLGKKGKGVQGSEQEGARPCVVFQNNVQNYFSPTVIVLPITKKLNKNGKDTHVFIDKNKYNLKYDGQILCEQIRAIDKKRIHRRKGHLDKFDLDNLEKTVANTLGIHLQH